MGVPIEFDRHKCVGREAEIIDALLGVAFMLATALVGVKVGVVPAGSAKATATMLCELMNSSLPDLNFRVVTN